MEQELFFGDRSVGHVLVERQELYYVFHCRCKLSGETTFRLFTSCGEKQEGLGVLVPMGNFFGLNTRRPVKRLGEGVLSFRLVSKHDAPRTHFAPISPEEPFAYLQRLKDAYLAEKDGQMGAQWEESL